MRKYARATASVLCLRLWFGVAWALIYVTVFTSVSPHLPSVPVRSVRARCPVPGNKAKRNVKRMVEMTASGKFCNVM
jgi:hypothetical protein